ncbi:MAG: small multi-drug export protein [Ruminococcaceae bacterium]|nr:small multi-drug export protein [Oscillospiraceae bacterium]
MVQEIVTSVVEFLKNEIPPELIAFVISLFPVLELRGGMIASFLLEIDFIKAFLICYIANMIPIPFILLFIRKIFAFMRKNKHLKKVVEKLEARSDKKKGTMQKYKEWGLLLFVAIPLPGTGGWTGALIAALMDLRFKKCLPIIALGVFIAGIIMSLVTYGIF